MAAETDAPVTATICASAFSVSSSNLTVRIPIISPCRHEVDSSYANFLKVDRL